MHRVKALKKYEKQVVAQATGQSNETRPVAFFERRISHSRQEEDKKIEEKKVIQKSKCVIL